MYIYTYIYIYALRRFASTRWLHVKHDYVIDPQRHCFNTLSPGRCGAEIKHLKPTRYITDYVEFKSTSCKIAFKWMLHGSFDW